MNPLFEAFLNKTYTLKQAKSRLLALKNYFNRLFFKPDLNLSINQQDLAWINSLDQSFLREFNKNNMSENLKNLEEEISKLKPLIIYLPFEMPFEEQTKLGLWLRQKINKNIIYDIKIDQSLIGGCAFSINGVYKDYSIKQRLIIQQQKIFENFKSYMR